MDGGEYERLKGIRDKGSGISDKLGHSQEPGFPYPLSLIPYPFFVFVPFYPTKTISCANNPPGCKLFVGSGALGENHKRQLTQNRPSGMRGGLLFGEKVRWWDTTTRFVIKTTYHLVRYYQIRKALPPKVG